MKAINILKILNILCIIGGLAMILFVSAVYFLIWTSKQPCPPPERPSNVPLTAVYKGGCDGGHWIELVSIKTDTCRFRIYRNWIGELLLDADFVYESNYDGFHLTETNWREKLRGFDETSITANYILCKKYCTLLPVPPFYYAPFPEQLLDDVLSMKALKNEKKY